LYTGGGATEASERACQELINNLLKPKDDVGSRHTIERPQNKAPVAALKTGDPSYVSVQGLQTFFARHALFSGS
jgi:hypothetical protein